MDRIAEKSKYHSFNHCILSNFQKRKNFLFFCCVLLCSLLFSSFVCTVLSFALVNCEVFQQNGHDSTCVFVCALLPLVSLHLFVQFCYRVTIFGFQILAISHILHFALQSVFVIFRMYGGQIYGLAAAAYEKNKERKRENSQAPVE